MPYPKRDESDPDDDADYDLGAFIIVFGAILSGATVAWFLARGAQWLWQTYLGP